MSTAGRFLTWTSPRHVPLPLPRPAGALWLVWRQHRVFYLATLALAALAGAWAAWQHHLLVTGVESYAGHCGPDPFCGRPVPDAVRTVLHRAPAVLNSLPLVVAALLGAPLFAQDIERGTHRLAWTQSIGRAEWVVAKLLVASAVTAVAALLITAPVSWWWSTVWHGRATTGSPGVAWRQLAAGNDWPFFEYTGTVGIAHLLLALLTGATAGLLLRRVVPAVAVGAAAAWALRTALRWLRPRLLPAGVRPAPTVDYPPLPPNTWHLGGGYLRTDGTLTPHAPCPSPYPGNPQSACLHVHGIRGPYTRDLRPAQFLPLHLAETALCLVLALVLAFVCVLCVRRVAAR
ncbi:MULTISPECIES: ABC transporter permease subunit [Streptomyces]|uniref:Cell wall protein n=1 Tax=Streptomyces evansiae TaxID=3075535 RepID=A0ABU2R6U5_9ACTN|nr:MULTISPECIES: ABC transporter permease subunit [unclassified Streptomyces]MDT0411455.1 cell wall protein [Streptomyces sp. DSM 41979]MYQ56006.1 cell wall protein [Streptomyces sp. SID4926]